MRRAALLLAGTILLAGCAGVPRAPATAGAAVDPEHLTEWIASGRIGIAIEGDGGSGTFAWQQRDVRTDLTVRGPLGAGGLRVQTDGVALTVTGADGVRLDAEAAREAIRSRLGVDLPVAQLRYWLLGLPAPGSEAQVAEQFKPPLRTIDQANWSVQYDEFVTAQGWRVPARLTANSGRVRFKAVIDRWELTPHAEPASGSVNP
jgi:outer membrane lipoprotein LolB